MGLMDEAAREQAVHADAFREDMGGGSETNLGGGGETNFGGSGKNSMGRVVDAGAGGQIDEEEDMGLVDADARQTGSSSRIRYPWYYCFAKLKLFLSFN